MIFDIDAGGQKERVSWTDGTSDVAFLAFDRDGNGTIDDGSELFGSATRLRDGSVAEHGFQVLADFDAAGTRDGRIDLNDPIFPSLRLWLDRNHNGASESNELFALPDAGLTTVLTSYSESRRVDRHGNRYTYVGTAFVLRHGRQRQRAVSDVFLTVQR